MHRKYSCFLDRCFWTQFKHSYLSFDLITRDVKHIIFHQWFLMFLWSTEPRPFNNKSPLPKEIPAFEVQNFFQKRLKVHAPVANVYSWLFHWCGFDAKNWRDRDSDIYTAHKLIFLQKLVDDECFFFGFEAVQACMSSFLTLPNPFSFHLRLFVFPQPHLPFVLHLPFTRHA